MKSRIASTTIAALMMTAGVAAAQSVPVTVSNQGSTVSPSANASAVTLGSFTLVSNQSSSANIASIPLTLTTGSGGNPSDLSSCQVYSSSGTALSASGLSSLSNGTQTVTFNSPFQLGGNQSASFTVRCNVGSTIASGATYQFSAGTPTLSGSTSTNPTGAALSVALGTTPVVRPGAQDAPLAVITFSASNSNSSIQVASLPINLSFASGASAGSVSDCRVRLLGNLGTALNSGNNVPTVIAGSNVMTLDSPLTVSAGNSTSVVLTCDIASTASSGSTILVSVAPSSVAATVSGSSTSVTPTTATTASGGVGPTSGSVLISTSAPVADGPLIPGVPNTGFGGETNLMVVAVSAIAMILGAILLRRRIA
jgi:fibronectin-binding autotransporter adhesin